MVTQSKRIKGWECYGIKCNMDVKFDISETLLFEKKETCKILDAFSLLLLISRLFSSLRSTVNWNIFMQCISMYDIEICTVLHALQHKNDLYGGIFEWY